MSSISNVAPWQLITTEDGSETVCHSGHGQAMHSKTGAFLEAQALHVEGANFRQLLDSVSGPIKVCDIGFGVGWNWLALLAEWQKIGSSHHNAQLEIVSLENDLLPLMINPSPQVGPEINQYYLQFLKQYKIQGPNWQAELLIGDAIETLHKLNLQQKKFHVFFQDAFSMRVNPELWSVEWFALCRQMALPQSVLTTYSAATQVKKNLTQAGWRFEIRPLPWKKETLLCFPQL